MDPDIAALPAHFTEWHPVVQAATLAGLTLIQEDLPTVSAALFAATGGIAWQTGYWGCFFGIWLGDTLLYLAARRIGRPLLEKSWFRRWASPEAVARSERWFGERGVWLLVGSRFVPGTRLPTYLAAGFLRQPFGRFLLVTGVTVALWTVSIFLLAHTVGDALLPWLQDWSGSGWIVLGLGVAFVVLLRLGFALASRHGRLRLATWLVKWTKWEFWPAWLFYAPVALRYLQLSIRHRSFTLPSAANPGIETGGLVGESKFATQRELWRICPEFTAETWFLESGSFNERSSRLQQILAEGGPEFPFILKPDIGQRGMGVKLVRTPAEADAYLRATAAALVLQRYLPGPLEIGVFYYRFPNEAHGHIFSITEKIFPVLRGDGRYTVEELVWRDERARYVAGRYLKRFANRRSEVLAAGETLRLVVAGNHAQGCIFVDGRRFATPELASRIDAISRQVPGFFFGRYDLRCASEEDLLAGRNFHIIELNGAAAEATSVYDARNSALDAYRTLFRQWSLAFEIGAANRALGVAPNSPRELLGKWRSTNALIDGYPVAD
jgi:membrane protein DedA with SNARE-associated domain